MRRLSLIWAAWLATAVLLHGSNTFDADVLGDLRREGFERSRVYETLVQLADISGPRLTGSQGLQRAQKWTTDQLRAWGLSQVRLEAWGRPFPSWELERCTVELVSPYYSPLIAYPSGWSPALPEVTTGRPVPVLIREEADFARFRGKLRGKMVLLGEAAVDSGPSFQPDAVRLESDDLARLESPREEPADLEERRQRYRERQEWRRKVREFVVDEGVALLLERGRGHRATVFVSGSPANAEGVPTLVLATEDFGRLSRMIEAGADPAIRVELRTKTDTREAQAANLFADLPGSDPQLRDQVVMLGAHLDSWHAATGASDNATGCAVVMEAMRLLKATGLQPRRTVRLALWSGEEQGLLGSKAYVKARLAPEESVFTREHQNLSAYFNLDNGAGRIRGVYLEGNEAVRPVFAEIIEPLKELGVTTLSPQPTGSTDHVPFDRVGLPAFQFIQDPLAYYTVTHHSNLDVVDQVVEDDLKQAAVVLAWFAYRTAMLEERLPRKTEQEAEADAEAPVSVESLR
jgi:carboxypeptidase Q